MIFSWLIGGFRDSLDFLEELGIQAPMPSFMSKGEKQMTTESANTSRLVTKIRWVVESANSRIKQWKYLRHVLPTSQTPYIGDFIRIVCAICNRYMKPLFNGNATEDESLGCKMLFLSKQVNALQQHVEEHHLDRPSVCWEPVDDLKGFPYLDEEQLRNLTALTLTQLCTGTLGRQLPDTCPQRGARSYQGTVTESTCIISIIPVMEKI
nr:uncharacterized protein LOC117682550 [Crassostrea gigas]